jgi:methionine synthase II (cobalamin-independent)
VETVFSLRILLQKPVRLKSLTNYTIRHIPNLNFFKYLQQVAGDTVAKYAIPSPNMLHFRGEVSPDVYPDEDEFFDDLVDTYRQVLQAFYEAGVQIFTAG